ncbi:unnamed protein product [Closterium sp. NIES-65]|nr:unnamed protein product [Closterium sp. NIES-65]
MQGSCTPRAAESHSSPSCSPSSPKTPYSLPRSTRPSSPPGSFTVLNCYPFFLFKDANGKDGNGIVSYDYVLSRLKTRPSSMIPIPRPRPPTGYLMVLNCYPFFPFKDANGKVSYDYAMYRGYKGFHDGRCYYQNLMDAMLDGAVWAFEKLGYPDMPYMIGEAGRPTLLNSKRWITGFLARTNSLRGTPKRPDMPIRAFLFELFDEDLKDTSRTTVGGRVSWACWKEGGGLDCARVGSKCGAEMKVTAVYNAWFQKQGRTSKACDFGGMAQVTMRSPSKGACQLHGWPLGVK